MKRNGVEVCPSDIVAKLNSRDLHLGHLAPDLIECELDGHFKVVDDVLHFLLHLRFEKWAVFGGSAEHEILLKASLLDRESLQAVREGRGTELLLPLGEVGASDGRHGVALLPLGQVVSLG